MFIVLLKYSTNKKQANEYMEGHNQWIKRGFDEGVSLLAGSLQPGAGGAIIANGLSREALEKWISDDPFVVANVVSPDVIEIDPKKANERLAFLLA